MVRLHPTGQVIDATNIHITTDGYVETKDQDKIEIY